MTTSAHINGPLTPDQAIAAERAIRRCLLDYCRGIDRCDETLVASVIHVDGTGDYGSFVGLGSDFAKHATAKMRVYAISTMHLIGDSIFDFTSLLTADVETPIMALHRCRGDDGEFFERFGGRYFDHFECRDGDWRIAHRKLTQDWDTKELVEPAFVPNRFHPSPRL